MAFDGQNWDETKPVNADLAAEIDDNMRDMKIGVRSRMAHEHIWSASQTATGSDGQHNFITLSTQTSTPGLVYGTSTQAAAIFAGTDNAVKVVDKTGVVYTIVKSAVGLVLANGTGTLGAVPYITSGGGIVLLGAGTSGYILTAAGAAAPAWAAPAAVGGLIGDAVAKNADTAYQAATDGFIVGSITLGASATGDVSVKTDANADPTAVLQRVGGANNAGANKYFGFCVPVKKGNYYKLVTSGTIAAFSANFVPMGV